MAEKQYGRYKRKPKTKRYWNRRQLIRNKLKRILRSNGLEWATQYAKANLALGTLRELTR